MSSAQAKAEARLMARKRRAAAQAALGHKAASQLADRFFEHVPLPPDGFVAGYLPIGSEADPSEIMRRAAARGHGIALPCVEVLAAPLVFRLWKPGDPLAAGPHGTRSPVADAPAVTPALLLLPLLAFDRAGRRLGQGGGYYDRTLEALRSDGRKVVAVGLAFSAQEAEELPEERGDQRLDWIVTETAAIAFAGMD
jgi:5-formyltetrahydrofolate cyclo-ligase